MSTVNLSRDAIGDAIELVIEIKSLNEYPVLFHRPLQYTF